MDPRNTAIAPFAAGARTDRREFLRRTLGVAASASGLIALDACGSNSTTSAASGLGAAATKPPGAPTGRLRVAMWDSPGNYVPVSIISDMDFTVLRNTADGLLQWSNDYSALAPALATSYDVSPDGRHWTFHLRPNVTFHDGEPFNSAAVKANFEYFLKAKAHGASYGFLVPAISAIDDSDPTIVRISLPEPSYGFAQFQVLLQMLSPKALSRGPSYLASHVVGTGAYKLKSSNPQGVVLVPNDRWWGQGPYFSEVALLPLNDEASQVTALEADNVDLVTHVLPRQLSELTRSNIYRGVQVTTWGLSLLIFRCDLHPMTDPRVRKALSYAIDREQLSKTVMGGTWPVWNTMSPAGLPGTITPDVVYNYDPERARSLLAAAGFKNGFSTWLGTGTTVPNGQFMVEAIAEMLGRVGLNVRTQLMDNAVLNEHEAAAHTKFTMFFDQNTDITGTGGALYVLDYFSAGDAHYSGQDVAKAQSQLATTSVGSPESIAILHRLQSLYAEKVPILPMFAAQEADVWRQGLQNYYPPRTAIVPNLTSAYWAT